MATARLSPAASLLRNSKLFALPAAVALPPAKPSSDLVPGSDTATSLYPTHAAIETPLNSLSKGDWGLKRALPARSITKSGTPVIRLKQGIDTADHVADFESAADHVMTLQKWQELNVQMSNRPNTRVDRRQFSVFHPGHDNTAANQQIPSQGTATGLKAQVPAHLQQSLDELIRQREAEARANGIAPRQTENIEPTPNKQVVRKRWRYNGPWLAGMTDFQFDAYLKNIADNKVEDFRSFLKRRIIAKQDTERQKLIEQNGLDPDASIPTKAVTDEDVKEYLRQLRNSPKEFGPVIEEFLDLPEGPERAMTIIRKNPQSFEWLYARDTRAADTYKKTGPPRTHPSAGFSYVRSDKYARNNPTTGPQTTGVRVPARVLKDSSLSSNYQQQGSRQNIGVAGIVARLDHEPMRLQTTDQWMPKPGGTRIVVRVTDASVQQNGALEVAAQREPNWLLDEEEAPYDKQERREPTPQVPTNIPRRMDYLDGYGQAPGQPGSRASKVPVKPDEDVNEIFRKLDESFGR